MIITRKIEVFVCESDKDLRKEYYDKLHTIRDIARKEANAMVPASSSKATIVPMRSRLVIEKKSEILPIAFPFSA